MRETCQPAGLRVAERRPAERMGQERHKLRVARELGGLRRAGAGEAADTLASRAANAEYPARI